jgi:beta-lactamase regulating signal transducer with metallopeptidase domain
MSTFIESNVIQNPRLAALCLDALLKSFVVLAFAGGLCLAWRRAAAATRHLIWFLALMGLLFLPLLSFVLPAAHRPLWSVSGGTLSGNGISLSLELAPVQPAATINNAEAVSANNSTQPSARESARRLFNTHVNHNWLGIGFVVWMSGLFLALLYPVLGQFQLRKISAKARPLETLEWTRLLIEATETLAMRRPVTLLQSSENVMPLTWGWLFPKVLLPAEAGDWPDERRRIVLLHELAHVKRCDCLTQSIARVVCAVYWFNPLAWIAARQMRIERERACDDLVLNGGCKASEYAGHLVQIATAFRRAPQVGGIAMARSSNLQQRVSAIVDASRARRLRPAGLAGVLISIAAVIFYIGGYKTSIAASDAATQSLREQQLAQIENFSAQKEKQSQMLAAASGETIVPQFQRFFDAAKRGDFQTVTNMYADFKTHHPQYTKGTRLGYRTSYWSPMLEICLVYDHLAMSDPKYTQIAVDDMINSIPAGSIYFGGTDPGRGLPTAFSKSQVNADPFYTITQNALADGSYLEYLRNTYGEKRLTLAQVAAARLADPELSALDKQFQEASQKALDLEMSKPDNDPEREAAEKIVSDLNSKMEEAFKHISKTGTVNGNFAAANQWSQDKVIYIPTGDDSQQSFVDYMDDAKKRLQEHKLKAGEDVRINDNGRFQASGQIAVMEINARIAKIVFDKNPNREFYIEESFPLDWMYPHLEPHGLILKINREPMMELSDEVLQKDHDYWQRRVNEWLGNWLTDETPVKTVADFAEKVYARKDLSGFTGDADFVRDNYAPKMFSKWRSAIGGVYSWRIGVSPDGDQTPSQYMAKTEADRQRMIKEADFALKQAFVLCPASPEAVYRYVNFLKDQKRNSDAILIAQTAASVDPGNAQLRGLVNSLSQ